MHHRLTKTSEGRCERERSERGQSLVESAILTLFLVFLMLNTANFAYFFMVALHLTGAPRSGAEYSMLGFATPGALSLAAAGPSSSSTSVSWLTYQDMTGALPNASGAALQVCSQALGVTAGVAGCQSFGGPANFPGPGTDPETPNFIMQRVDVSYTFQPLVPGTLFNLGLLPSSLCSGSLTAFSCTFHGYAEMRAMN